MFHMDLLRNCESTPTVRICDPVKNEVITVWLDETKRKKRETEDEGKNRWMNIEETKRNRKKPSAGNLNSFIVKSKKGEVQKSDGSGK